MRDRGLVLSVGRGRAETCPCCSRVDRPAVVGQGLCVRNESFYTTAAQVLPTLLIALVLEGTAIFRRLVDVFSTREHVVTVPHAEIATASQAVPAQVSEALWDDRTFRRLAKVFLGTITVFLLGEVCALLVVFVGTDSWFVWPAAPVTGLALVAMLIAIIAFPLIRVATETVFQTDDMARVTVVDDETGETYGWIPQPSQPGEQRFTWGLRPGNAGQKSPEGEPEPGPRQRYRRGRPL